MTLLFKTILLIPSQTPCVLAGHSLPFARLSLIVAQISLSHCHSRPPAYQYCKDRISFRAGEFSSCHSRPPAY
ncbi:MAG: hypothetical protein SGI89_09735, partial [bacterium]|nr:hypothetical protein [bacterium]